MPRAAALHRLTSGKHMQIHRILFDATGEHKQGLRTEDPELAERWVREAPANAIASGHIKRPVLLHIDPACGDEHGNQLIRSVHRLHIEHTRDADGSLRVHAIHHYPDKADDDDSGPHPLHPLLTKRQAVKIPARAARDWRVIDWQALAPLPPTPHPKQRIKP